MNKLAIRRRYLLSMFFLTLNDRDLNANFFRELLVDLLLEQLIWSEIVDPESYGEDTNQHIDFIERGKLP